jgi:hypothetical protein
MVDLATVLLGGGVIATVGTKVWEEWRQREALRFAFGAEIEGLLKIAAVRQHEQLLGAYLEPWRKGEDVYPVMWGLPEPPEDPIFTKNADKIGLLGRDTSDVVLFYTLLKAVRVDVWCLMDGKWKAVPPANRAVLLERTGAIWSLIKPLGQALVGRLRQRWSHRVGRRVFALAVSARALFARRPKAA